MTWERSPLQLVDPWSVILAGIFAGWTIMGVSYLNDDSAAMIAASTGAAIGALVMWVLLTVLLYLPLAGLFRWLDRLDSSPQAIPTSMRSALRASFVPTWLTILAGWFVWLAVHIPGAIDADTITQRLQWIGMHAPGDHHPWFDTIIFGWFFDLGAWLGDDSIGLFLLVVVQELALAAGIAAGLCYLSKLGLRAPTRWVLAVVAAVFPMISSGAAVISKDSVAAVFWLPFLILFIETLRTRGRVLTRPWVGALSIAIIVPLVLAKRTNIFLVLICAVVVVVVVGWRQRALIGAGLAVVVATTGLIWPALLASWRIEPPSGTDMYSLPVQQTARITLEHGADIPPVEREAIDRMLGWEGLGEAYVARRSDSVKARWQSDAPIAHKMEYLAVWAQQGQRYPGTAFSATLANTFEYFAPVTPVGYQDSLQIDRYLDGAVSRAAGRASEEEVREVMGRLQHPEALTEARDTMNRLTRDLAAMNPFSTKAFVASWLPMIALVAALRRRNVFLGLATVPLFVQLAFFVAGPVALPRYLLPMVMATVLVAGLVCVSVPWQRRERSGSRALHR